MTIYTVRYFTEADWAEHDIEADTAERALEAARRLADDDVRALNFQSYDGPFDIEHIEITDPSHGSVAEWRHVDLTMRLAARDLLDALEQAVTALNTAPRFPVPALRSDSYRIAQRCDRAIARAKGGAQ